MIIFMISSFSSLSSLSSSSSDSSSSRFIGLSSGCGAILSVALLCSLFVLSFFFGCRCRRRLGSVSTSCGIYDESLIVLLVVETNLCVWVGG